MKINRNLKTASFLSAAALILITAPYFIFVGGAVSSNPSDWANFGTYVGGTSTALALVVASLVYSVQSNDFEINEKERIANEKFQIAIEKIDSVEKDVEESLSKIRNIKFTPPFMPPMNELEIEETSDEYNQNIAIIASSTSYACTLIKKISKSSFSDCKSSQIAKINKRIAAICKKSELEISEAEELFNKIIIMAKQQGFIEHLSEEIINTTQNILRDSIRDLLMIPVEILINGHIEN